MTAGSGPQYVRALKISLETKTKKLLLRFVCKGENSVRGTLRLKVAGRLFLLPGNLKVFVLLECCWHRLVEATPGMRRVLEPRAPEGRWSAVPVPKGQPSLYKQHGRQDEPQERGPQPP